MNEIIFLIFYREEIRLNGIGDFCDNFVLNRRYVDDFLEEQKSFFEKKFLQTICSKKLDFRTLHDPFPIYRYFQGLLSLKTISIEDGYDFSLYLRGCP